MVHLARFDANSNYYAGYVCAGDGAGPRSLQGKPPGNQPNQSGFRTKNELMNKDLMKTKTFFKYNELINQLMENI